MNLRDYMHTHYLKTPSFAKMTKYSSRHINAYLAGTMRAGRKFAETVEEVTHGKVTAREILAGNAPRSKKNLIDKITVAD